MVYRATIMKITSLFKYFMDLAVFIVFQAECEGAELSRWTFDKDSMCLQLPPPTKK